jgi:hypothetical protein
MEKLFNINEKQSKIFFGIIIICIILLPYSFFLAFIKNLFLLKKYEIDYIPTLQNITSNTNFVFFFLQPFLISLFLFISSPSLLAKKFKYFDKIKSFRSIFIFFSIILFTVITMNGIVVTYKDLSNHKIYVFREIKLNDSEIVYLDSNDNQNIKNVAIINYKDKAIIKKYDYNKSEFLDGFEIIDLKHKSISYEPFNLEQ